MNRLAVILLFVAGCSSPQADPWHDYLIALQVHDFELKAVRQAEQIDASSMPARSSRKHWLDAANAMSEHCLICASAATDWGRQSQRNRSAATESGSQCGQTVWTSGAAPLSLKAEAWSHGAKKNAPEATGPGGAEIPLLPGRSAGGKDNRVAPRPCGNRPEPTPPSVQPQASLPLAESTVVTLYMKHSEGERAVS